MGANVMSKHNKKRNTAFIYETLLREIVKQSVAKNKDKRNIGISLLKENFKKGTQLRKDLDLYKALLETTNLSEKMAEKLIAEAISQHDKIDQQKLFSEQSNIISLINKELSKNVFSNFVPNYKSLATISQMFSNTLSPKRKVMFESHLIKNLSKSLSKKDEKDCVSNLVVNSFIKRFNETYKELHEEQREMLTLYIDSGRDNGTEFKFYLNEEIERLKKIIKNSYSLQEVKEDEGLKEKLNTVKTLLNDFNQSPINNKKLIETLKIQNLVRELV
jgi:hypothetical protein